MKRNLLAGLTVGLLMIGLVGTAPAAIIDFTGGTAYLNGGGTATTNNSFTFNSTVDYYVEDGFKLDFIGGYGTIGNYYGGGNDVIHAHWATGHYGTVTEIRVSKVDGTNFELNYFELTSNTDTGGGAASGNEQAYINSSNGFSLLLPTDNWGWSGPNPQIFLDSNFDDISYFSFTVANEVDCFGMDMFYIDEPAPPNPNNPVPEPSTMVLLGSGLVGLMWYRRKNK